MAGNTITISVLAQTGPAAKGLSGLAAKMDSLGGKFSKAGNVAGLASAGIVAGIGLSVKSASELQQMVGGVQAVFGKYSKSVIGDSKAAASAFGLSATEYDQFATLIGSQLKNAGVPMKELGSKTKSLIGLGSDLAATFGGSTSDAVDALSSAMKGEMDPIEKYGISLNQSMLQQQAAAMGISKNTASWTNAQKQQVILAAVTKQSGDAQGQFAKQSGTLAEQQQIIKAKLDNTVSTLGGVFLPLVSKVAAGVLDMVSGPGFKGFVSFLSSNPTLILGLVGGFIGLAATLKVVGIAMQSWSTITKIASGVQAAFNFVLSANPIGLIILAIAALVVGLVYFFTQTKTGQKIIKAVWGGIQTAIRTVTDWFTRTALPAITGAWRSIVGAFQTAKGKVVGFLSGILTVIKTVWSFSPLGLIVTNWGKIIGFFTGIPGKVKGIFGAAVNWLHSAGNAILTGLLRGATSAYTNVYRWLTGIPGRVKGAVGNLAGLLTGAGRNLLNGLVSGIQDKWNSVKDKLQDLTNHLPDWKGPAGRDKTLLTHAGRLIMQGLVNGLDRGTAGVKSTLQGVTALVQDGLSGVKTPAVGLDFTPSVLTSTGRLAGGNTYVVHLSTLNPTPEVGRLVVEAINDYERVNGSRA